jgi:predicted O-methyltransferase YrrM
VFHDAGHHRDGYIADFNALPPALRPNSVVLMDDIRWHGLRPEAPDPRTYEGAPSWRIPAWRMRSRSTAASAFCP